LLDLLNPSSRAPSSFSQPPLALELARRNKLEHLLPFSTVEGAAKAYSHYDNLQEFLDLRDATLSVNALQPQHP
jgi:hypothetical protein